MNKTGSEQFEISPETFNALGRNRFGRRWTGQEFYARDLPPPARTFRRIDEATASWQRRREYDIAAKVKRAKRAAAGVRTGPHYSDSRGRRQRGIHGSTPSPDQVAHYTDVAPEIIALARDKAAYRKEYAARKRRDRINSELLNARCPDEENPVEGGEVAQERAKRKRDPNEDVDLANRFRSVIAKAKSKWPQYDKRPSPAVMAKILEQKHGDQLGYKWETMRKILSGHYQPAKNQGFGPLT